MWVPGGQSQASFLECAKVTWVPLTSGRAWQGRWWEPCAVSSAGLAICGSTEGCGWPSVLTCVSLSEEGRGQPWTLWGKGAS